MTGEQLADWNPAPDEAYRTAVAVMRQCSIFLQPSLMRAEHTEFVMEPESLAHLSDVMDNLAQHISATRMQHFSMDPTGGSVIRALLQEAHVGVANAALLLGQVSTLQKIRASTEPEAVPLPAIPSQQEYTEGMARATRAALKGLGWQYPDCLPGEPNSCGEDYMSHVVANLAILGALINQLANQLPQTTWEGYSQIYGHFFTRMSEEGNGFPMVGHK